MWRFLPTDNDLDEMPTYGPLTAANVAHLRSQRNAIDAFFARDVPGAAKLLSFLRTHPKLEYAVKIKRLGYTVVADFVLLMELTAGEDWRYLTPGEEWIIHHNLGP
jgi:hypothetical protein